MLFFERDIEDIAKDGKKKGIRRNLALWEAWYIVAWKYKCF